MLRKHLLRLAFLTLATIAYLSMRPAFAATCEPATSGASEWTPLALLESERVQPGAGLDQGGRASGTGSTAARATVSIAIAATAAP
jgi:hypothetical protein